MKWTVSLAFLMTTILMVFQNCGKTSTPNLLKSKNKNSAENGYFIVVPTGDEPDQQVMNISDYNDENYLSVARAAIQSYENQVSINSWFKSFYAVAQAVNCGSVITSSVTVSGTLDCTNYAGKYGLIVYGNDTIFDGTASKFKLIFPQGKVGILVYGNKAEVKNVEVNDMTNGMGILLYDSNQGNVESSMANNNLIGITAYAENHQMNHVTIKNNEAKNNVLFGIRINSDWSANKRVKSPEISNNDLSGNQYYALHIRTDNMTFDSSQNVNTLTGSMNGWYLTGGEFEFENMNINTAATSVQKTHIFVAEAEEIELSSVQLLGGGGNAQQEAYGLHVYKTGEVNINGSGIQNYNVGMKVSTEGGTESEISVSGSSITNNTFAGIIIQGYDNTELCPNVSGVSYSNNPVHNLWKVSGGNFCN